MRIASLLFLCGLLLICGAFQAVADNVFSLPSSPFDTNVPVYVDDPFQSAPTVAAGPGAVAVIAKPDGSRFYIVSRSATDTIVVVDSSLTTVLRRIDLGQPAEAAALTPDGRRLLVLAGTLRIFDTTTANDDEIAVSPTPDVGSNPMDLAISHDSTRAFILSDASDRLTTFNLSTNLVVGSPVSITGILTGVAVAPNGLVYATCTNRFYEIDSITGVLRGQIALNALPRKPAFTPDGQYAVLANAMPQTGSVALLIDLKTRTVAGTIPNTGANAGLVLDEVRAVDDTRLFAVSTSTQRLVEIRLTPTLQLRTSGFPFDLRPGILNLTATNELPSAKHLLVATSNTISRGTLATSQIQDLSLPATPSRLVVAGPASFSAPVSFRKFNDNQTVTGGATTPPLILRVWDVNGKPVFNRTVQFSTQMPGVTIETPTVATNTGGFAGTRITVPSVPGPITITANVSGLPSPVHFEVTVAGGGGGAPGGLSILSGNGQVVERGFLTPNPLRVTVRDGQGQPIIGATVNWSVTGEGSLSPASGVSTTDINGIAEMNYVGPSLIAPGTSWIPSTVTASATGLNTVTFTVSTVPNLPQGYPAYPTVLLLDPPQGNRNIAGRAGQVLQGAVRVEARAITGFQSGQGMPGVGVELSTGLDPLTNPSASCVGGAALTDATGIAVCDVQLGGVTGTVPLTVLVGGFNEFVVVLSVDPGPPGLIRILSGNNQSGDGGQLLPLALVAEVSDGFGHVLANVPVVWEAVVPGTVTISNASTASDSQGKVSARATLENTPGPVQVRVRTGSVQAVFNLFVNLAISSFQKISGDNQTAVVGTAFSAPLVVQVMDQQGQPVTGATVSFAVASGSATVGSPEAATNSQGQASTTVTAGGTAGPIVVTASIDGESVNFNLNAIPPGPVVSLTGIRSAISGDLGVSPGGIVAIYGSGLAPGIQGSVVANTNLIGPLPTKLANVEVLFGTTPAPIYAVNNVSGMEFVSVQAPFTLGAPGTVSVTIKVGGGSTVVNDVPVRTYQPGIFETLGADSQLHAVLLREDGSYVSPANPAQRGERIRMFASGLGQTDPATGTNRAGIPGQKVRAQVVVGINDAGVIVHSAETMIGVVGVYMITFEVPADTTPGSARSFGIAIIPEDGGPAIYGNPSTIAIQ